MNMQKCTQKSLEALQSAQSLAIEHANQQLDQEHLLAALCAQQEGLIPQMLKKMDLFSVSEIRKSKNGDIEIKFFDRMQALQKLSELESAEGGGLLSAIVNGAAALRQKEADDA